MEVKVDPTSHVPMYHQVKEWLREKILSGEFAPGDKIASEKELQELLHVSRATTKQAISILVNEGLLYRRQGKGTFVSTPKVEQNINKLYSFSIDMAIAGMNPSTKIISIEKVLNVKKSVIRELQLCENECCIKLVRLRLANNVPLILETTYLPEKIFPNIENEDFDNNTLYKMMSQKYNIVIKRAKESFEPTLTDEYESKMLELNKKGLPALLVERTSYNSAGIGVEYTVSIVRGDKCKYCVEMENEF